MTQAEWVLLKIDHPDLVGWRPERPYLVPPDWRYEVTKIRTADVGGLFDRRERRWVYADVVDGSGERAQAAPYLYERERDPDLPDVWAALEYVREIVGDQDLRAGWGAVKAAHPYPPGPGPDARTHAARGGPPFSLNDLSNAAHIDAALQRLKALLDEVQWSDADAAALNPERIHATAVGLAEAAYRLGSVVREGELAADYAEWVVKAKTSHSGHRTGAFVTNAETKKRIEREYSHALELAPLEFAKAPPSGRRCWTLTNLAAEVFAAWRDEGSKPSPRTIRGHLKAAQGRGTDWLQGLK